METNSGLNFGRLLGQDREAIVDHLHESAFDLKGSAGALVAICQIKPQLALAKTGQQGGTIHHYTEAAIPGRDGGVDHVLIQDTGGGGDNSTTESFGCQG